MTTLTELCQALSDLDIPWVNTAWHEDDSSSHEPPYIVLMARPSGGRSAGAADGTWLATAEYDVEFYAHERSYDSEKSIEEALDAIHLFWVKDFYFIESESLTETVYTVTVRED